MQQILISPELKGREAEADFSPNIQKKKNSLLKLKREKKNSEIAFSRDQNTSNNLL